VDRWREVASHDIRPAITSDKDYRTEAILDWIKIVLILGSVATAGLSGYLLIWG
jgi:hypothetical protein